MTSSSNDDRVPDREVSRVAVIGPGAIGSTVAAWLHRAGHEVAVIARTAVERIELTHPDGRIAFTPQVVTTPDAFGPVDWVIVATKAYDSAAVARWLTTTDAPVAILQNGVEHGARFSGLIDPGRIVPAIVDVPAERSGPGVVLQRRAGTILVPDGPLGSGFAALFAGSLIATSTTDDFVTAAWAKLALNAAGIVNALTLRPAAIAHDPAVASVMRALAAEAVAVGRAEGAKLADTLPDEVVVAYRAAAPDSVNSLHADRLAGRPMEIDARNGVVVRLGERHGIATPINAALAALLAQAETPA